MTTPRALAFACCLLVGCSGGTSTSDSGTPPVDGGGADAGAADAGSADGGPADAGPTDAGVDAGPPTCGLEAGLTIPSAVAAKGVVLDAGTFMLSGQPRPYQLLKLPGADGKPVYAQWVPGRRQSWCSPTHTTASTGRAKRWTRGGRATAAALPAACCPTSTGR